MKGLLGFTLIAGICVGSAEAADRSERPFPDAPTPLALDLASLNDAAEIARLDRDGDGWLAPVDLGPTDSFERQIAFEWARVDALEAIARQRLQPVFARWPDLDPAPFAAWLALSGWALEDVAPALDSLQPVLLQPWMDELDAVPTAAGWFSVWALQVADRSAQRVGRGSLLRWGEVDFGQQMLQLLADGDLRFGIDPSMADRNVAAAYTPHTDTVLVPPGWDSGDPELLRGANAPQISLLHELRHAFQDLRGRDLQVPVGEVDAHLFATRIERLAFPDSWRKVRPSAAPSRNPPDLDRPDAVAAWVVRRALGEFGRGFYPLLEDAAEVADARYWWVPKGTLRDEYAAMRMRGNLVRSLSWHLEQRQHAALGIAKADVAEGYARADAQLPLRRLTRRERARFYSEGGDPGERVGDTLNVAALRTSRIYLESGPGAAVRWLKRELSPKELRLLIAAFAQITIESDGIAGYVLAPGD